MNLDKNFMEALFIITKSWNNPNAHAVRIDKYIKIYPDTGMLFSSENK